MPAGKLGHGSYLNNVSDQGHIGGPVDGSPHILRRAAASPEHNPTIVVESPVFNGVAVYENHVTKVLGRAAVMKRVNVGTSAAPVWVDIVALVGNNEQFDGKLLTVDDDGRGTIGQVGMNLEFEVPDSITLEGDDVGKRAIGAGNGMLKPVALPARLTGTITVSTHTSYLNNKRNWDLGKGKITRVIPKSGGGGTIHLDLWTNGAAE